jgi:hypothetical protein
MLLRKARDFGKINKNYNRLNAHVFSGQKMHTVLFGKNVTKLIDPVPSPKVPSLQTCGQSNLQNIQ